MESKKLKCRFTLCINNASCCMAPSTDEVKYCELSNSAEKVGLKTKTNEDGEVEYLSCKNFFLNENKISKCLNCQLEDYGEISIPLINMDMSYKGLKNSMKDMIEEDDYIDE